MLSLAEEIVLIALDEEKGTMKTSMVRPISYGIAGALLMDLLLINRITLEQGKIRIMDIRYTQNPILDSLLEKVSQYPDSGLEKLIESIGEDKADFQQMVIQRLLDNKIIRTEEHKTLGLIRKVRHPIEDATAKNLAIQCLRDVILKDKRPDQAMIYLVSLIRAMDLTREIFSREERKVAQNMVYKIASEEPVGRAIESLLTMIDPELIIEQ